MNKTKNNGWKVYMVLGIISLTGTYNAVVMNSESQIPGDVQFVKRLDEIYGITVHGREVAASMQWQKLTSAQVIAKNNLPVVQQVVYQQQAAPSLESAPVDQVPAAAVQEELTMNLVEVSNVTKWKNGLTSGFSGSLSTKDGVIESLSVSLPDSQGLSISFSEMKGNVFEYDMEGELYSGIMYQVDQTAYMVTLSNGPLEGTRLRFSTAPSMEAEQAEVQETLAQNDVQVGGFGAEPVEAMEISPEQMLEQDKQLQLEAAQAQGFNLEAQAL